jgi:SAM-dependent methyltransferase
MPAEEFVGYEDLIRFMEEKRLCALKGDIIEIGAYMGGGTAKLAAFARPYGKKVFAVDTFDPQLDDTRGKGGVRAGDVYQAFLSGRSMLEAYREATKGLDNVVTIQQDSRKVALRRGQRFCFGFVDGCHQQSCVENDFRLIWPRLVPGGAVGFHDYAFDDWPEVTTAVDGLITAHAGEIREIHALTGKHDIVTIMLVRE